MNSSKFDNCPPFTREIAENINKYTYLLMFSSICNALLALTATLGNGLVIVTILKSQNLQTPSYLLITSLAFTDLFIGLIYHPILTQIPASFLTKDISFLCRSLAPHYIVAFLGGVSIVMNVFISIDRYLALKLKHRYRIHVTKKRVRIVIVVGWVSVGCFSLLSSFMSMFSLHETLTTLIPALILVILTFSFYFKSFITLHRYTLQIQAQQPNQLHGNFDVVKYRKTLKTMVSILICYLVCCVPLFAAVVASYLAYHDLSSITTVFLGFIIFSANSSINPVIYLTRFKDVRQECRNLLNIIVHITLTCQLPDRSSSK